MPVLIGVSGLAATVGRGRECDVRLLDATVSRRHARITLEQGLLRVTDLRSRNGTYLEGRRITIATGPPPVLVRFGSIVVRIELAAPFDAMSTVDPRPRSTAGTRDAHPLTPRQAEVCELLSRGLSEKEIAVVLGATPNTIHNHVREIYRRFGVQSRAQLLAKVLRRESAT